MRWLIIEDSLESRRGHWFEYLENFHRELPKLGDEVTLLVSKRAEPCIQTQLGALPCLPESAFGKMSDGAPGWRRYVRIPAHAWKTFWEVRKHLRSASQKPDVIFVPTVIVHHLLGWFWLIKTTLRKSQARVLLFFPGLPIVNRDGALALDGSPSSKLMRKLLRWLEPEIRAGKVILGVETQAMKQAAEQLFTLSFTYFPHPVTPVTDELPLASESGSPAAITMACYGLARYEKGSDVLAAAMQKYLERFPRTRARFVLQWLEGFKLASGEAACLPSALRQHPRVEIVGHIFAEGEYAQRLTSTQVLLLSYRCSSYALRVSRVIIEAMVNGIPVVVTRGTTLAQQAEEFGAAVLSDDENVESLVKAILQAEQSYQALKEQAKLKKTVTSMHFSVKYFRDLLYKLIQFSSI